jgi:hypothetical protein
MGTTANLLLPYPELNDPANVPTDMRELAEAIEKALGGTLPSPVTRYNSPAQNLAATTDAPLNPVATLRNPHLTLYLMVRIRITGWLDAMDGSGYLIVKSSGSTGYTESGGVREYRNSPAWAMEGLATVAPGATLTVQPQGHKGNATDSGSVRLVRNVLTPIGWLKTGAIA